MRKYNKIITGCLTTILITGTTLSVVSLNKNNDPSPKYQKPLNRGDNYQKFSISEYIKKDDVFLNSIETKRIENQFVKMFNEENIKSYFKNNMSNILEKISIFKEFSKDYISTINYQLSSNNQLLLIDIVWTLPNSNLFYYDQFKVNIL